MIIARWGLGLLQVAGLLAVLAGAWLSLVLWAALLVCGAIVVVAATAGEVALSRRPAAPPVGRSGSNSSAGMP